MIRLSPRPRTVTPPPQTPVQRAPEPAPRRSASVAPRAPVLRAVPGAGGPQTTPTPHHWALGVVALTIGSFLAMVNANIAIVPVPAIEKEFNIVADDASWISTAYRLGLALAVPLSAWLGERLGLRRLYMVSLVWLGISSLLCGLADDLPSMIAFRVLQAVPGAIIPVTCMTALFRILPPPKFVYGVSIYAAGTIAGPAMSPLLAGVFTEQLTWRLVFLVNVPLAVVGVVAARALLPVIPATTGRRRFDLPGYTMIALSLFSLALAVQRGQTWGWTSYPVLALFAVGANAMALFVGIELWVKHPLLNLRVFRNRTYTISLLLLQIIYTGMQALVYFLPMFLLVGQALTPSHTGLYLLPEGAVWLLATMASGPLFLRYGPRWATIIGLAITGVGASLLTRIGTDLPRPTLVWMSCLAIAGVGLCLIPVLTGGTSALPPEQNGDGMTFRNMIQRVTGSFSLTALTTMTTIQQTQLFSDRSALLRANGADSDPAVLTMLRQGPDGVIPLFQEMSLKVTLQTYSNVFVVVAIVAFTGAVLAYALPWGIRPRTGALPTTTPVASSAGVAA